jgi:hypothetical protein
MSLADSFVQWALFLVGHAYTWGDEPWYAVGSPVTSDPYDTDCSGLVFGVFRKCGVLWKTGAAWPRLTAQGYHYNSVSVAAKDIKVGDIFVMTDANNHAYHTGIVIGKQADGKVYTVEARGRNWGVVKYAIDDPVNGVIKRGGKFKRFPWMLLGEVSVPPAPEPPPLPNYPTLKRGMYNNKYVVILQQKLNAEGYTPKLLVDGDFGYKTLAAVEWFQARNKDTSGKPLEVDGIVGPKTWGALLT